MSIGTWAESHYRGTVLRHATASPTQHWHSQGTSATTSIFTGRMDGPSVLGSLLQQQRVLRMLHSQRTGCLFWMHLPENPYAWALQQPWNIHSIASYHMAGLAHIAQQPLPDASVKSNGIIHVHRQLRLTAIHLRVLLLFGASNAAAGLRWAEGHASKAVDQLLCHDDKQPYHGSNWQSVNELPAEVSTHGCLTRCMSL